MKNITINQRKAHAAAILKSCKQVIDYQFSYTRNGKQVFTNAAAAIELKENMIIDSLPAKEDTKGVYNSLQKAFDNANFNDTYTIKAFELFDIINNAYFNDGKKVTSFGISNSLGLFEINFDSKLLENVIYIISNSLEDTIKISFNCNMPAWARSTDALTRFIQLENKSGKARAIVCPLGGCKLAPYYFFENVKIPEEKKQEYLNSYNQLKAAQEMEETLRTARTILKAASSGKFSSLDTLSKKAAEAVTAFLSKHGNTIDASDFKEEIKEIEQRINSQLKKIGVQEIALIHETAKETETALAIIDDKAAEEKKEEKPEETAEIKKEDESRKEKKEETESSKNTAKQETPAAETIPENKPTEKQLNFYHDLCLKNHIEIEENLTRKTISVRIGLIKKYGGKAKKVLDEIKARESGGKNTAAISTEAADNKPEFESVKIISDDLEKAKIISLHYNKGVFLEWYTNEKDRMHEHILKTIKEYVALQTKDDICFEICLDMPAINKNLWYDDETEAPENTFENFKLYNIKYLKNQFIKTDKLGIIKEINKYNNNAIFYKLAKANEKYDLYPGETYERDLTEEETRDIRKIYQKYENDYLNRLNRYWNRYSDKIHWEGYWVNR